MPASEPTVIPAIILPLTSVLRVCTSSDDCGESGMGVSGIVVVSVAKVLAGTGEVVISVGTAPLLVSGVFVGSITTVKAVPGSWICDAATTIP